MEAFLKDLKQSIRMFLKAPAFTFTAIAALALGIGANTAIFSVINTVLLRPLPFPDPDRLVMFLLTSPNGSGPGASPTKFNIWREQTAAFEDVSAYATGAANLTGVDTPEQVQEARVSAPMFRLFGLAIAKGRSFTKEEDQPHGPHVAVLSDQLWKRRFGADPEIIGKNILLSGDPYEIIGVTAPEYRMEADPPVDLYVPFQIDPNSTDQAHYFTAVGRLRPGVTLGMAKAQLQLAADEFRRKYPGGQAMGPQGGFSVEPCARSS